MWMRFEIEDNSPVSVVDFQEMFWSHFSAAGEPEDAAIYSQWAHTPNTTIYLSPGAVRLMGDTLQGFGAEQCDRPASEDVALLIGHHDAGDTSFLA